MTEAFRKAARAKGGKGITNLIDKWTKGKYSSWNFKIYYSEIDRVAVIDENNRLKRHKRKLEDEIEEEKHRKAKVGKKLQAAVNTIAKNQKTIARHKKKFKMLAQKIIKLQRKQSSTRGPAKNTRPRLSLSVNSSQFLHSSRSSKYPT